MRKNNDRIYLLRSSALDGLCTEMKELKNLSKSLKHEIKKLISIE